MRGEAQRPGTVTAPTDLALVAHVAQGPLIGASLPSGSSTGSQAPSAGTDGARVPRPVIQGKTKVGMGDLDGRERRVLTLPVADKVLSLASTLRTLEENYLLTLFRPPRRF